MRSREAREDARRTRHCGSCRSTPRSCCGSRGASRIAPTTRTTRTSAPSRSSSGACASTRRRSPLSWMRTVLRHEALAVRGEREQLVGRVEIDLDRHEDRRGRGSGRARRRPRAAASHGGGAAPAEAAGGHRARAAGRGALVPRDLHAHGMDVHENQPRGHRGSPRAVGAAGSDRVGRRVRALAAAAVGARRWGGERARAGRAASAPALVSRAAARRCATPTPFRGTWRCSSRPWSSIRRCKGRADRCPVTSRSRSTPSSSARRCWRRAPTARSRRCPGRSWQPSPHRPRRSPAAASHSSGRRPLIVRPLMSRRTRLVASPAALTGATHLTTIAFPRMSATAVAPRPPRAGTPSEFTPDAQLALRVHPVCSAARRVRRRSGERPPPSRHRPRPRPARFAATQQPIGVRRALSRRPP